MKYRSIKTPPAAGTISVRDAVKSAKTVARSAVTGRFVKVKGANPRTTYIIRDVVKHSSQPSKAKKTTGKSHAGVSISKRKVAAGKK